MCAHQPAVWLSFWVDSKRCLNFKRLTSLNFINHKQFGKYFRGTFILNNFQGSIKLRTLGQIKSDAKMSELKCFRSGDKYHALEPFEKTRLFEELSQQLPVIIRVPLGVNAECVGCPGSSRRQLLKMQKSAPLKTRARIGRRFTTFKVSSLEIVEGCTQKNSEREERIKTKRVAQGHFQLAHRIFHCWLTTQIQAVTTQS
jgi:hypothetical protein